MELKNILSIINNQEKIFYVYELCEPTGIPFYVGKGKLKRICEHELQSRGKVKIFNNHKCNIIRKIWAKRKQVDYRVVLFTNDEKFAFDKEKELINFYGRVDNDTGILSNLSDGGEGQTGFVFSDEILEKLSLASKGKNNPMYGKKGELAPGWGRKHTEKEKRKMSEAMKGKNKDPLPEERKKRISMSMKGKNTWSKGRRHSEEAKRKISEATSGERNPLWGKPRSKEVREKIRLKLTGRKVTSEITKKKMSIASKGRIPWNKGLPSCNRGKHWSKEVKKFLIM